MGPWNVLPALLLSLLLAAPAGATCPAVKRSAAVVRAFRKTHPCPATGLATGRCEANGVRYVLDHIIDYICSAKQGA